MIQAAAFAEQGQVYMLDMGEEVRILDLAEKMIRLKGLTPGQDVPIVYTGLRPGEKVREELVADHEQQRPTRHSKVMLTYGGGRVPVRVLDAEIDAVAAHLIGPVERPQLVRAIHHLARLSPASPAARE